MNHIIEGTYDADYFNDVVDLAMFTIEIIAKEQYRDEEGNVDWSETFYHVSDVYDGPCDVQMFNEAIELIEESALKYNDKLMVPPGETIH